MLLSAVLLISSCSGLKVSTDYDPASDFQSLKQYQWYQAKDGEQSGHANSPLMDKRIRATIESHLAAKDLLKTERTPDFYLNYSVTTEDKVDIQTHHTYSGYAPGWGWRGGVGYRGMHMGVSYSHSVAKEYQSGTLIIDIIDPASNQLIWRGLASKKIPSTTSPEKLDELVNVVVEGILKQYPPQS